MVAQQLLFKRSCKLMGNHFEFSAVGNDEQWANQKIDAGIAEIQRIEKLLTTFSADSETNQINNNAGIAPVAISRETFNLIKRSHLMSRVTQGVFDISYGSIDKRLWNFDLSMTALPDAETGCTHQKILILNYPNYNENTI